MTLSKKQCFALIAIASAIALFLLIPPADIQRSTSTVLLDRNGQLLGAAVANDDMWRFPQPDSVPHRFATCLLQFEDAHFYHHLGFNPMSMLRAMRQNLRAGHVVSGASTITMQLVRLARGQQPRTYKEKIVELIIAFRTELTRSKRRILATYTANAPFGGNVVGLDAAAWRYYGIAPHQLSWAEAAALAVLPNAPGLVFPGRNQHLLLQKRNRLLLKLMNKGIISNEDYQLALLEPLPNPANTLPQDAPHLLTRCITSGMSGKQLHSSIDKNLQLKAQQVAQNHHNRLMANDIHNIAIMVIDNVTGQVLAYVGNIISNQAHLAPKVDIIGSKRSYGSLLKPFLYALMLAEGEIMPQQLVDDCPVSFVGFTPRNFNLQFSGAVPAHEALARSLNVPAVNMLQTYGVEKFHRCIKNMGMPSINRSTEHYGLSLILGGAESTMLELAGLYCALARCAQGTVRPKLRLSILTDSLAMPTHESNCTAIGAGAAYLTLEALSQASRPDEQGILRHFAPAQRVAWKTGTSMGFRDAWAIGVTPQHTVAVWAGNADGEGRPNLTGTLAAAPAMFDIFALLPRTHWFQRPLYDLMTVDVCPQSGHLASTNCPNPIKQDIPLSGTKTLPCPYHQRIFIDKQSQQQVNLSCANTSDIQEVNWFVLPPVPEWFYKQQHPEYKALPPFRNDCQPNNGSAWRMALIYPHSNTDIYLPRMADSLPSQTLFRATHSNPNATIYWHLNETFVGSTTAPHELLIHQKPGTYTLTIVDDHGQTLHRRIRFVGPTER